MLSTNDPPTSDPPTSDPPVSWTPGQTQGCLLGLSFGLILLTFLLGYLGQIVLPFVVMAFVSSMLHAVFLVSLYPPIESIRSLHWLQYGVALLANGCMMIYALSLAELYFWGILFVVVLFIEIAVVSSWRGQRSRALLQYALVTAGLFVIPAVVSVRDPGVLATTVGKDHMGHTRFLLALGADVRARNSAVLNSALHRDIDQPGNLKMMQFLLDRGADPNAAQDINYGIPILTATIYDNRPDMTKLLLDYGADPNRDNSSALFEAVRFNRPAMVGLLIARGANVRARNERGWSTLFVAPDAAMARYLIERGVELDVRDQWGQTALFEIVREADVTTVAVLVEQGFDVNARDTEGRTPLIVAVDYTGSGADDKVVGSRGYAVVQYLLERGADVRAADRSGRTAFDVARQQKFQDVEALLRAAGATE